MSSLRLKPTTSRSTSETWCYTWQATLLGFVLLAFQRPGIVAEWQNSTEAQWRPPLRGLGNQTSILCLEFIQTTPAPLQSLQHDATMPGFLPECLYCRFSLIDCFFTLFFIVIDSRPNCAFIFALLSRLVLLPFSLSLMYCRLFHRSIVQLFSVEIFTFAFPRHHNGLIRCFFS